jgi:magnesium chelatase family protein
VVHLARIKQSVTFPAKFILVVAMNPCPCGFYGDAERECKCSAYEIIKYQKKISGPLLDRIDLQVKVGRVAIETLQNAPIGERRESAAIRECVARARTAQNRRYAKLNAELSSREAQDSTNMNPSAQAFLETLNAGHLSPRGYYRLIKVARTIADIEEKEAISSEHLAEAFSYRLKEIF